jgi:hypothetical protein
MIAGTSTLRCSLRGSKAPGGGAPGTGATLEAAGHHPFLFLARHSRGDWGELCPADKWANDRALREGDRLLSAYKTSTGERLWVITEADRSATTILLPSEY